MCAAKDGRAVGCSRVALPGCPLGGLLVSAQLYGCGVFGGREALHQWGGLGEAGCCESVCKDRGSFPK